MTIVNIGVVCARRLTYLHEQWCQYRRYITGHLQKTSRPKPPLDAVVECKRETRAPSPVFLSPCALALSTVAPERPPDSTPARGDIAIGQTSVVLVRSLAPHFERADDLLRDDRGGAIILQLVQVGCL